MSKPSTTTHNKPSLITHPPSHLGLRQNVPQGLQDERCQNAIIASVDRATVEVSRTIIALSATFSSQLQEASDSASSGIRAAQTSASASIGDIVSSADAAASSATASLDIANRAMANAMSAMEELRRTSSSEVAALSSSLSLMQASMGGIRATRMISSVSSEQTLTNQPPTSPLSSIQSSPNMCLAPGQIAGIVIGSILATVLLLVSLYFAIMKCKSRQTRDSYLDKEFITSGSRKFPYWRSSSSIRTGNGVKLVFSPPVSSSDPPQGSVARNPL
ncbi:hypothetical protein VTL71DRAFT_16403 [Oculimacula yallundae]|uniref:Uncharacterized protein n=1 Tax=Oculimacula yallundae TaxID=86028 RepID=A0ABR4CEY7_9HELO